MSTMNQNLEFGKSYNFTNMGLPSTSLVCDKGTGNIVLQMGNSGTTWIVNATKKSISPFHDVQFYSPIDDAYLGYEISPLAFMRRKEFQPKIMCVKQAMPFTLYYTVGATHQGPVMLVFPKKTLAAEASEDGGVKFTPTVTSTNSTAIYPVSNTQWWNFTLAI